MATLNGKPTDALAALFAAALQGIELPYEKSAGALTLTTAGGAVTGATAVLRSVGGLNAEAALAGKNDAEATEVTQWVNFAAADLAAVDALEADVPMMRTLANIGVQYSARQTSARSAVQANADLAKALAKLNTDLAASTFLVGDRLTLADAAVAARVHDLYVLFLDADYRRATYPHVGRWLGTVTAQPAFFAAADKLCLRTGGATRIGGQIDLRPVPEHVSALADLSVGRNTGAKKAETQRQAERSKRDPTAAPPIVVAAKAPAAPAAASGAGGSVAGLSASVLGVAQGPERVAAALAELALTPSREESPRTDVARPFGHSTHNLLVRDKKNKDAFFLVTLRQDRELNLSALAKLVGTKEVRFAAPEDTKALLGSTAGCITPLWLINDPEGKVQAVWDSAVLEGGKLRICAGCADPKDHTQHNVVDIAPADLQRIAQSGTRPEPKLVSL